MRKIQHPSLILGRIKFLAACCENNIHHAFIFHIFTTSKYKQFLRKRNDEEVKCQILATAMFSSYNVDVSRKCEEPSDFRDFKSAQIKLFCREMKIILQCMLKFNTLKSRHDTEMLALSRSVTFLMGLAAHKDYNSAWYYTSSYNPLRPLMFYNIDNIKF